MDTKTSLVRKLVASGDYKKALSICKDWRGGIASKDVESLRLGYECIVNPRFYQQLHYNIDEAVNNAILTLCKLYGN